MYERVAIPYMYHLWRKGFTLSLLSSWAIRGNDLDGGYVNNLFSPISKCQSGVDGL
jgi:hypothetical protein